MRKIWSEEEMNFIRENISVMSIGEMSYYFNVSYEKTNDKIHKMGLNRKQASGELWQKEEDEILTEHFQYAPKNYLMDIFPNRSWNAILQRGIKKLNLSRESQDRYYIDYNFFEDWGNDSAYIYGMIAADGHLFYESGKMNKNALQFEMADYDRDILDKIKYVMKYEGPVLSTKRHTVKLQINNKKIIKDLIQKGIPENNKTFALEYPRELPQKYDRHFIRGLFDGDGSVYKHGSAPRFQLLGTKRLLEEVLKRLPIDNNKYSIYDRNKSGSNVYSLQIGGKNAFNIFNWLYEEDGIFLDRKNKKLKCIIDEVSKK
ncbi:MAG: LAGLIDADG family homing endonuclease [Clostridium sp.]|uniref:LAGLIDADG family homing endonuclease n=1 Tax=Clostridium TaxID=1485 RepID=UPI0023314F4C|nr:MULTISPECIES: LAGLIDADG family homing endonuclease [Clostridium]MDB1934982.1 LAGLIDADG family homing endonuclease [Clostridium tertium]MDB1939083.1 LAGLIDADG family homing endonuclease [Clostridium tertium]MDU3548165.1 LAGLIDADG family homing endonuclease [Clostridium sp.]MDY4604076.1 LAGLIDADG family homing endonuclease [Clostridium tertium]